MLKTKKLLHTIQTDTIIFQGKIDHEIDPSGAVMLLNNLGSKHKEIVWVDNSYHVIPIDFSSQLVLDRILKESY